MTFCTCGYASVLIGSFQTARRKTESKDGCRKKAMHVTLKPDVKYLSPSCTQLFEYLNVPKGYVIHSLKRAREICHFFLNLQFKSLQPFCCLTRVAPCQRGRGGGGGGNGEKELQKPSSSNMTSHSLSYVCSLVCLHLSMTT